jgi:hypothetical protein
MEMVALSALWLPILVSAIIVFIASFVAWMVLPHHRSDWAKLPDEDSVRAAIKGIDPGEYSFPHAATSAEWKSPEWLEKMKEGPNGFVVLIPPGPPAMNKSLVQWFIYCLVISTFAAYVTGSALGPGSDYLKVFQITGTVAFLAYSAAYVTGAIWMGHRWSRTLKDVFDGLVYGLLTAGAGRLRQASG